MKANDLMIGNYVSYNREIYKVVSIVPPFIYLYNKSCGISENLASIEVTEDEIEAIPITSNILDNIIVINGIDMLTSNILYNNLYMYMKTNTLHNLQNICKMIYGFEFNLNLVK
jgi:hypothetical protein